MIGNPSGWLGRSGRPGAGGAAYYCEANECLFPRRLHELAYGCELCPNPYPLFKDLRPDVSKLLPARLQDIFVVGAPECPEHACFRIVPRCPVCGAAIDPLARFAPVGIWGAANVGKTVYCAVLARELQERLYPLTGMTVSPGYDRGRYEHEVVRPLFALEGCLPRKTRPDEHRKLVLRLDGAGWLSRKLILTDMSGEIYALDPYETIGSEDLERKHRMVLLASESIFLVNPEGSERLGARAHPDLHGVLSVLIGLPRIQERLATAEAVAQLARALKRILETRYFPAPVYSSGDVEPFQQLAEEMARRLEDDSLVEEIRECLETSAGVMARATPFAEQLHRLWHFMYGAGCRRIGDKLEHRIAIAVSKSDMLCDRLLDFDDVLRKNDLPTNGSTSPAPRANWRRALREISSRSEQALIDLGEAEFVTWVRSHFSEVGIFFISSLGRATEPVVTRIRRRPVHQPMQGQAAGLPTAWTNIVEEPEELQWEWGLDKRMTLDPEVGSRAPAPKNVLLPLLWLLAEA